MNEVQAQRELAERRSTRLLDLVPLQPLLYLADRDLERLIDDRLRQWRSLGYLRAHRILRNDHLAVLTLSLDTTWGEALRYDIRDDEIRMGGLDGIRQLLNQIQGDLFRRSQAWNGRQMTATEVRARQQQLHQAMMSVDPPLVFGGLAQGYWAQDYEAGRKAEQKSKDLFRAVAGEDCFRALENGGHWMLNGSKGGIYRLYKRASFCVQRKSDGARMCAVVPGVPLWDHLLGIKLVIETDEPKFLKTANKMGEIGGRPGGIAWVDEAAGIMRSNLDRVILRAITG